MNLTEFLILGLFDSITYILISKKLLSFKTIEIKKVLIYFITMITIDLINYYYFENSSFVISMVVFFLLTWYIYEKSLFQTFYSTMITLSIMLIIQAGILVLSSILLSDMQISFSYGLLAQCFVLIIIVFITKFVPLNLIFNFIDKRNRVFIGLTINGFFLIFIILLYWKNNIEGFFENTILIGTTLIVLCSLNFLYITKGLENKHERLKLKMYNNYQKITEDLIGEIRARQHEFDNHIQAIKMSESNLIDHEYINNLEIRNDLGSLIKLDSNLLSGLLYLKKKKANESNIDFKINIETFDHWKNLKEYELIDIVGNLLDNAFEAVEEKQEKKVILTFKQENKQNIIEVMNNYRYLNNSIIEHMFDKGYSTKSKNGRGFGLYNIRKIVKKYKGSIEVQNKNYLNQNYILFKIRINKDI